MKGSIFFRSMQKSAFRCAVLVLGIFLTAGCRGTGVEPEFLTDSAPLLRVNGENLIKYDPATSQLGYRPDRFEFRLHNDTMSEYYILTCSARPDSEGKTVRGTLKYATDGSIYTKSGLEFRVEKVGDDGNVWLWCSKRKTGITVRILE